MRSRAVRGATRVGRELSSAARYGVPLVAPAPHRLGTGEVQSFSSYLRGVASLHVVPVSWLFNEFVVEPLRRERGQSHPIVQATRASESVNGATPGSVALVARAADLFGQPRLVETTLL